MEEMISVFTPSILTLLFSVPLIYALYLRQVKKLTAEKLCIIMLASGFILRLAYVSYTDICVRQHDLGYFYEPNNYHAGYMLYLMSHHRLPDFDPTTRWQFYHPPLHHIISAIVLSVIKALGLDYTEKGPDVLQFISCIYSTLFSLFAIKTMKRLGIEGRALELSAAAVIFHPTLVILSGSMNNDMLSALFSMLAIYFTVRWAQSTKLYDIIGIALSIGLGMMTKLTVGLLAPAVALVFLIILIKKRVDWKRLVPRFVLFGAVCIPLGMFWPVRNFVRFGTPLNYVPALDENSGQFIDVPAAKRLFDFSVYQFSSPFSQWEWNGDAYNEFNPVIALLKNAMFDESTFFPKSITLQSFCTALFFAGAVTAVLSAAAVVILWSKGGRLTLEMKTLLTVVFAVIFGNYIIFCLNYPQVCTQNMRYCVPLIFVGSASLGLMKMRADEGGSGAVIKKMSRISSVGIVSMAALSCFVYMVMMYYEAVV